MDYANGFLNLPKIRARIIEHDMVNGVSIKCSDILKNPHFSALVNDGKISSAAFHSFISRHEAVVHMKSGRNLFERIVSGNDSAEVDKHVAKFKALVSFCEKSGAMAIWLTHGNDLT